MPENLFKASKDYTKKLGYRNLQEFILELIRKNVILDNIDRYKKIEEEMKVGKKVKKLKQKEALNYLKSL